MSITNLNWNTLVRFAIAVFLSFIIASRLVDETKNQIALFFFFFYVITGFMGIPLFWVFPKLRYLFAVALSLWGGVGFAESTGGGIGTAVGFSLFMFYIFSWIFALPSALYMMKIIIVVGIIHLLFSPFLPDRYDEDYYESEPRHMEYRGRK